MRLLGDEGLAEECVADTFSRFLQALQSRKGPKDYIQAYLYRVAHNWVVDYYRRKPPLTELDERFISDSQRPEDTAFQRIRRTRLRVALQQLTPDQQMVITLKFLEGFDNQAISKAINKPIGAVKSLQHRALQSLKRILSEEDFV